MTELLEYLDNPNRLLLCDRQGLHREEPLDLVCLDPLCRNSPLGCSVCFNEIHKVITGLAQFHRVVTLSKFYDDYCRNARKFPQEQLTKQIKEARTEVEGIIRKVRETVNKAIDNFESQVRNYTDYLFGQMQIRQEISRELGVELDSNKMKRLCNLRDLRKTVGFVLNNSEFDDDNNMTEISELLVANSSRVLALSSKLEYMTLNCQRAIQLAMAKLQFAKDTISEEKITAKVNLANSQCDSLKQFDLKAYHSATRPAYYQEFRNMSASVGVRHRASVNPVEEPKQLAAIDVCTPVKKRQVNFNISRLDTEAMTRQYSVANSIEKNKQVKSGIRFINLLHPALRSGEQGRRVRSSINAIKPQFALAEPHVELQPLKISSWAIRIARCRNLSCLNTLAVGLVHRKEIEQHNFEARPNDLKRCYLLTSQGDVMLPGRHYRNEQMRFSEGSTLHFKFDPYYGLFEIKKENGKILSLKVQACDGDPLYFCTRMTYASDQVQIVRL